MRKPATLAEDTVGQLERIIGELRAVPVNVEIKVVPVQENGEPVENPENEKLPMDVERSVEQG